MTDLEWSWYSCCLTDNRLRLLEPIIFHQASIGWTEAIFQHKVRQIMSLPSVSAKTAQPALGRHRPRRLGQSQNPPPPQPLQFSDRRSWKASAALAPQTSKSAWFDAA